MKIAIVGTGISGLTAAYILNRDHDITVFEKNNYIGGHTHTHTISTKKQSLAIDSGFIVYNEKTYPNFIKLLNQLEVQSQKTTMGFSVKSLSKNIEYAGNSLSSLFAQRRNLIRPSFLRMLSDIVRFNKKAKNDLESLSPEITLGDYLSQHRFSEEFIDSYIIPMGSAIWSTKSNMMFYMPAIFFIRFFNNHGLLQIKDRSQWWVIKGGSKSYVNKLIQNFKMKIRLNASVSSIKRIEGKIYIKASENELEEIFDAVVIACHSDQALQILSDPSADETEILSMIPYQGNKVLLHTDISVLPKRKSAWASWNYNLDQQQDQPVAMTYNMNILQGINSLETYCVTLNSNHTINKNKVLKELYYEHPLFTKSAINAQNQKDKISGINNTYYCGAYWHSGFHEDGVVSALEVCSHFGLSL